MFEHVRHRPPTPLERPREIVVVCAPLRAGSLEVILPEWSPPQGIVHCVFPSRRGVLPAVRALIDWLAETLPEAVRSSVVGI